MLTQSPIHSNKPAAWHILWQEALNLALRACAERYTGCDLPTLDRINRGWIIACAGKVRLLDHGICEVASQFGTQTYTVNGACSCPDKRRIGKAYCKHQWAAALARKAYALLDAAITQALITWPPDADRAECPRCGLKALAVVWDNPHTCHTRLCQAEITLAGTTYTCGWVEGATE